MRDSRAWQLVKGIVLILVFAQFCVLLGLSTVGFILGNTLSVLAIAFVVLFQPELRRALETVGRRSLSFLAGALVDESPQSGHSIHNTIEAIVRACDRMSETRTGALVVIERETRMSELAEQENSVILDAAVSSSMLQQIFYKGSPLHDGAVLVRNGRILAARCHIPLSDNLHLRRDYGTRHRAAVGASEMGDAIAVVVSEERGTISVSFEGRLYAMESSDSLRILLHKLLGSKQPGVISSLLRGRVASHGADADTLHAEAAGISSEASEAAEADVRSHAPRKTDRKVYRLHLPKGRQLLMLAASLVLACVLWFYVQVTTNPVETKLYTVPIQNLHTDAFESKGMTVLSSNDSVVVTLTARRATLAAIPADLLQATVDLAETTEVGTYTFEVHVAIDTKGYFQITEVAPSVATIKVGLPVTAPAS